MLETSFKDEVNKNMLKYLKSYYYKENVTLKGNKWPFNKSNIWENNI